MLDMVDFDALVSPESPESLRLYIGNMMTLGLPKLGASTPWLGSLSGSAESAPEYIGCSVSKRGGLLLVGHGETFGREELVGLGGPAGLNGLVGVGCPAT